MPRRDWTVIVLLLIALWAGAASPAQERPRHARNSEFNGALGVECTHCHVQDQWSDAGKPPFAIARDMVAMVDVVNEKLAGIGFVTCVTCHGGQVRPSRQPGAVFRERLAEWPAELAAEPDTRKITMTAYAVALGVKCEHCHSKDWKARTKDPILLVDMMTPLFDEFPKYMPATAVTQCYMCHKGSTQPQ